MRNDEVARKLERLEQEIMAIKSEQRDGISSVMSSLKQFQELVLEEKIAGITERLSLEYRDMALSGSLDCAYRTLDEKLPDPCPRDMRMKCLHVFLEHLESEAGTGDGSACGHQDLGALKGTPCEHCYDAYEAERASIARLAERMKKYRHSMKPAAGEIYMSQLPDDIVVSGIVEPLSHEARFRMLKSLSVKSMTYTELSGITGLDGGHLLYHLNKLVSSGLVDKADGKYAISERGMGTMELIKKLYSA